MREQFQKLIEIGKKFGELYQSGDYEKEFKEFEVGYYEVISGEVFNVTFRTIIVLFGVNDRLMIMKPELISDSYLSDLVSEYQVKLEYFMKDIPDINKKKLEYRKESLKLELRNLEIAS